MQILKLKSQSYSYYNAHLRNIIKNRKRNVKQKGDRCIRGLVSCQTRRKCQNFSKNKKYFLREAQMKTCQLSLTR
jgi:hypothetical protein